jgi:hypothetical protein
MSDKLYPDEKREYEYEDKDSEKKGEQLKDILKRIEGHLPSLPWWGWWKSTSEEKEIGFEKIDPKSLDFTGVEIEGGEQNRSFVEKAGLPTYFIIGMEFVLVAYFILALLGFVPMF